MMIQKKIRDAIMGISKTEIEKTAYCTVPVRLEDGKTLNDKKWRNMSAWAGCKREEVAVYIDDTIMGSCKKGVAFTAENMWFKETLRISKKEGKKLLNPLRYDSVRDIHWDAERSSYFMIRLEDAEVEVYAGIFAKFCAEALKQAVHSKALDTEMEKDVFSEAEAEEGYYCPACQKVCKPMAGYINHVCPYCGKVNRCTDLRKHKITQEDRIKMVTEDLVQKIRAAKREVLFEPWDTNVFWNNDRKTEELVEYGLDMLYTIMSDEGERAIREAYELGNMEAAYRLALLYLTEWHNEELLVHEKDLVLGREAARAAAQKGHTGAIALCKVLQIPSEEKPAPTREQQKKLEKIRAKLEEIYRKHESMIGILKEKYYFLKMMENTSLKEYEPLFLEWLDLVQQGEQLDDPFCIRELYEVTWSLKEHGFDKQTYYTSRMAEMGNGHAMVLTGEHLSIGKGCKKDPKAAMYYFRVAADMDEMMGVAAMARHYYDEKNKPGCLYWSRKLIEYKLPAAYAYIIELTDDPAERAQVQAQMPDDVRDFLNKRKEIHP